MSEYSVLFPAPKARGNFFMDYFLSYVSSGVLFYILLGGEGIPPTHGCAKKKVGVADFGVFSDPPWDTE